MVSITAHVTEKGYLAQAEDPEKFMDAALGGLTRAANILQADLRMQTRAAGLGPGLERAWALNVYNDEPAALIYSKSEVLHRVFAEGTTVSATRKRYLAIPTKEAEAMGLGLTDRSRKGGPVPAGQYRHLARLDMIADKVGEKNIRVVSAPRGRKLIIYDVPGSSRKNARRGRTIRGVAGRSVSVLKGRSIVLFILVPQVRLARRLDVTAAEDRAALALPSEIETALSRLE
ncbi:DUF6441 family protein [Granulibacter bethesdensis]|nr:DUF6441 family protein [Granulibacter bethesdensis]